MIEQAVPDFFPIALNFCQSLKKAPCPIYLLDANNNYEKKYDLGEGIHPEEIKMLVEAGQSTIYVDAINRLKFVNHVTVDILARLNDKNTSTEDKIGMADEALQVVQEQALTGQEKVTKETEELASSAIRTCLEIAKNNPTIAGLLKKLFAARSSFLYRHTQLIIYITQHIISKVDWGSTEQKEKLAFVAFFHDICLNDDKLAKYTSDFSVSTDENLTMSEKEILIKHAKTSAEIVQKFSTAPLGSDVIIMQHHGMISGQGYAKAFTNSISPLAIVFIIAEEFAHNILEHGNYEKLAADKDGMLNKISIKFPRSNYQRIIETLRDIHF
jgi:response regulator RpfG family c-di-GMP phosphodiesterase